jgi:GNAT superfamily N-acetyltransferase
VARDFYDLVREKAGFDPNDPAAVQERIAQINEASDPLLVLPNDWQDPAERIATVPPGSPSPAMDGLEFSDPSTIAPAPVEKEPEPEAAPATGDFYDRIRARGTNQPLPYQHSPMASGAVPTDVPLEAQEDPGLFSNTARRFAKRGLDVVGNTIQFLGEAGEWADEAMGTGVFVWGDGEGFRWVSRDELNELKKHKVSENLLTETLPRAFKERDTGAVYDLGSPERIKKAWREGDVGELAAATGRFIFETGIESIPDMIASVYGIPLYIGGRSVELAEAREINRRVSEISDLVARDVRANNPTLSEEEIDAQVAVRMAQIPLPTDDIAPGQVGIGEILETAPFAALSALFERIGAKGIGEAGKEITAQIAKEATEAGAKAILKAGGKAGVREGGTEFFQEGVIEYFAEKFNVSSEGLFAEIDLAEGFERGAFGALAGGGFGAAAGTGTAALRQWAGTAQDRIDAQLAKLRAAQEKAEQDEALKGGDELDQALAGAQEAAVKSELTARFIEAIETEEAFVTRASASQRAKRPNVKFKEGKEAGPGTKLSDEEIAAEIQTELEREQLQKEAGERYAEQKKRIREEEQAFEQREAELEKQKDRDIATAEGQVELQRAEQLEREAEKKPSGKVRKVKDKESGRYKTVSEVEPEVESKTTLGEMGLKAAKAANLAGRRILEAAKNIPAMLTDQRPSTIVVDPSGASRPMTAAELDSQVRRRWDAMDQMDLPIEERRIPVQVQGLELEIENPKGSTRKGERKDGSVWSRLFRGVHYGAINKTQGADGEKLDVYIGGQDWRATGQKVWVVNQYNEDGTFDEHKVMLGFANQAEAVNAFNLHKASDMTQGEVSEMTVEEFRTWALDGKAKNQPLISDTGTLAASEADIEAMRERARAKGLKPPKIMYKEQEPETVSDTLKKYLNKAGNLVLTHFSRAVGLSTLDPNMGPSRYTAEGKRASAFPGSWVARVAFGIGVGKPGGYQKESMLGSEKYQTEVRPEELYDLEGDPDGLRARIPKDSNPAERTNLYEKAVRDAGYRGYWVNDPTRGPMAVLFESVPVGGKKQAKPKILYKDPKLDIVIEEWEGEMEWEDDPGLGIQEQDYLDPNVRIYQARVNGRVVANMAVEDMWSPKRGEYAQIRWTFTQQTMRGKDVGKELLMGAIEAANKRGLEIVSDSSVSAAQLLVYDSLQRKGKISIEFSDPKRARAIIDKAKEVGLQNLPSDMRQLISEKPDPDTNGVVPVVSRIVALEYAEDVQYQKEQRNETLRTETNEDVRNVIDHLLEWMPGIDSTRVFILDDVSELQDTEKHPYYYDILLEKENGLATPGFHDSANSRIYVILNNHKYPASAISTFMHEATAHYGLRKVFGKDMDRLLDKIYAGANKALMREIRKYGSVESGGTKETGYKFDLRTVQGRRDAVEEMIAHAAEKNQHRSWVQEVVHFIREILRKVGILDSWTDTDILFLLRDIRRELRSTPLDKIEILAQAEIEETGEVVQLRQPADVALRRHDKRVAVLEKLRECVG